jgi:4-azaleucine resistance transporter AzlC
MTNRSPATTKCPPSPPHGGSFDISTREGGFRGRRPLATSSAVDTPAGPPAIVTAIVTAGYAAELWRGYRAMAALWPGIVPFAIAFALAARAAGFSLAETQALSMVVFAGSAQFATVTLVASGAGAASIVLTALLLNLRHVLYGLSLAPYLGSRTRPPRPLLAFFVTDESYGLAIRECLAGRGGDAYLFGASLSLYGVFAASTLAGALLGARLPDLTGLGLDFVFPLSFLALLLPLLRSPPGSRRSQVAGRKSAVERSPAGSERQPPDIELATHPRRPWTRDLQPTTPPWLVAALSALLALALGRVAGGGVTILSCTIAAAGIGAALDRRRGTRA